MNRSGKREKTPNPQLVHCGKFKRTEEQKNLGAVHGTRTHQSHRVTVRTKTTKIKPTYCPVTTAQSEKPKAKQPKKC